MSQYDKVPIYTEKWVQEFGWWRLALGIWIGFGIGLAVGVLNK